jgi:hypothetical protein
LARAQATPQAHHRRTARRLEFTYRRTGLGSWQNARATGGAGILPAANLQDGIILSTAKTQPRSGVLTRDSSAARRRTFLRSGQLRKEHSTPDGCHAFPNDVPEEQVRRHGFALSPLHVIAKRGDPGEGGRSAL